MKKAMRRDAENAELKQRVEALENRHRREQFIIVNPPTGNRFYRLFKP